MSVHQKTKQPTKKAIKQTLPKLGFTVDFQGLNIAAGIASGITVAITLSVAALFHKPDIAFSALGALYICLSVPAGAVRSRILPLLTLSFGGGLIFALFSLLRALPEIYILPVAFISLLGVLLFYGAKQPWGSVSLLLAADILIALDFPAPDASTAFYWGGLYLAGSLGAMIVFLVLWRIHPYAPVRRKVGHIYEQLAVSIEDILHLLSYPEHRADDWENHLIQNRYVIRAAIEDANNALMATLKSRGSRSDIADRSVLRLGAAEEIFSLLIALEGQIEFNHKDEALYRALRRVPFILTKIARNSNRGKMTEQAERLNQSINRTEKLFAQTSQSLLGSRICEQLRCAVSFTGTVARYNNYIQRPPLIEILKELVSWKSINFRHALRVSLLCTLALVYTLRHATIDQHWIAFAILFVMQPYSVGSFSKLTERVIGTVLGALIAGLIAYFFPSQIALILVFFLFSVIAAAVRAVNYGTYILFVTPLVIFLMVTAFPGTQEASMATARVLYTLIGGAMALTGMWLLWPEKPSKDLDAEASGVTQALADFSVVIFNGLMKGERQKDFLEKQRKVGLLSNNFETMLSRALHIASSSTAAYVELMFRVSASLRRITGYLVALQRFTELPDTPENIALIRDRIYQTLQALALLSGDELIISRTEEDFQAEKDTLHPKAEEWHKAVSLILRQTEILANLRRQRQEMKKHFL